MSAENEIDFSLKFLDTLKASDKKPTIYSPASILNAVAMIYAGCDGITAKQIERVIGGEKRNPTEILKYYSDFVKSCPSINNSSSVYKLLFSNKLFLSSNASLRPSFEKCTIDLFDNQFEQVDFKQNVATAEKINNFVNEKTDGLIKSIITEEDVHSEINIFVVNALCFVGEWEERFYKPALGEFYSNLLIKNIEMMNLDHPLSEYNLTKGENWRCLGIPYKTRNSWLHILLPNSRDGLPELIKELNYKLIEKCIENNIIRHVDVTIPAFKIENEINLKEHLKLLGLTQIFHDHGILKMFQNRHIIDKAIHKAGIKVS